MPLRDRLVPELQIECAIDESNVRERLGEIPDQAAGAESRHRRSRQEGAALLLRLRPVRPIVQALAQAEIDDER